MPFRNFETLENSGDSQIRNCLTLLRESITKTAQYLWYVTLDKHLQFVNVELCRYINIYIYAKGQNGISCSISLSEQTLMSDNRLCSRPLQ